MRTVSAGRSDPGRKRPHNEDAFDLDESLGLYVVADGVGGRSKGEVASGETVDLVTGWARSQSATIQACEDRCVQGDPDARWELRRMLEDGVQSACYMVFGMAELDPEKRGMSTTVSAVLFGGGFAFAAHVGDSRVYRVRDGDVLQITEDHTLINYKLKYGLITPEEATRARGKNVITRAVGHRDYVQIDTADVDAVAGDRFLLCTDGLHNYIDDDRDVATLIGEGSLEASASAAIAFANQRGGRDNITALVVEVASV